MATEISLDLINQLKVSLRREAKLSSFDPVADYSDSSIPSLPTAAEAIAELDASAPYLRCRNCKGKLLRGIESLICVFCGKQQRTSDNPPDPIKFTSTCGYKWFLSSLNLDGSEIVEPLKETNGSRRGAKAPVVKGIPVSKFLDLEIQWSAIEENFINSGLGDGKSVQNKNTLNLGGVNLDDFFVEGRGDLSKADPAESKPVEDDFKDPRSLSLFSSVKNQGVADLQHNGKDAQENVSSGEHENLSLFAGRDEQGSVSIVEQGNFGFFEEKDARHSFKVDENLSLFEGKDAQRTSSSKEDGNFGLFEGVSSSNAGLKSFDDKVVASSSDWDSDFRSVSQEKIGGDQFVSSSFDLSAHMDSVFGSGKDLLYEKPAESSTAYVSKAGYWLQDDLFGNVAGKTQNNDQAVHDENEGQVVGGNGSSSMDIDWMGDDLWKTSEKKPMTPTNDNDDQDDWNDFASSANSRAPNNPLSQTLGNMEEEIFDGLEQVRNDVNEHSEVQKQNAGPSVISDIAKGQEDDLFGIWDSSTSSTALQTPTNNMDPRSLSLFSSVKNQGVADLQHNGKDAQKNVSSGEHENLSLFAGRDEQGSVSIVDQGNFGFFEEKDVRHSFKVDENLSLFEGKDAQRTSSSKEYGNLGLFEGVSSSNAGLKSFDDKVVASSSDWDSDFRSVSQEKISGDQFVSSPFDLSAHMDSVFGSGKDILYEKPAESSTAYVSKAGYWLQDDLFGNVTGKTQNNDLAVHDENEGQVVGGNGSSSMDIDWMGDVLWQTSEKKTMTPTNDNDDEDDWNDFASSANSKTPNNPLSQTLGNIEEAAELNPKMNLFGDNHRYLDSDFFPGSIGGQTNSEEVRAMPFETSTLERSSDPDGKDQTLDLVGTTTISHKPKNDVAEELMTQTHDLSFMLESKLSVPPISKTE